MKNMSLVSKVLRELAQVLMASGSPRPEPIKDKLVYHGTNSKFDRFDTRKSLGVVWFSDSKDQIASGDSGAQGTKYIMERLITLKNPAGWDEYDRLSVDELIRDGYDGVILKAPGEPTNYIVFNTKSIKSPKVSGAATPDYRYYSNCTSMDGEVIDWIRGNHRDIGGPKPESISYEEFVELVPESELQHGDEDLPLKDDWHVGFYTSSLPSGIPIAYYTHSGIEWVFLPKGSRYDQDNEVDLVTKASDDHYGPISGSADEEPEEPRSDLEVLEDPESIEEIEAILSKATKIDINYGNKDFGVYELDGTLIEWDGGRFPTIVKDKQSWIWDSTYITGHIEDYLIKNFKEEFNDYTGVVWHATDDANVDSILADGLGPRNLTRGLTNRSVGAAIFTTMEKDQAFSGTYGNAVFEVDLNAMKKDGVLPDADLEPAVYEYQAQEILAHTIGLDDFSPAAGGDGADDPATIILYGHIDPKYLKLLTDMPD
jgi:hypothetical protein